MPLEIHPGVVLTAQTEFIVVQPGEVHFIPHEQLDSRHHLGIRCNEADDGGVVRNVAEPKTPFSSHASLDHFIRTAFVDAPDFVVVRPRHVVNIQVIDHLGQDALYTIVHAPATASLEELFDSPDTADS